MLHLDVDFATVQSSAVSEDGVYHGIPIKCLKEANDEQTVDLGPGETGAKGAASVFGLALTRVVFFVHLSSGAVALQWVSWLESVSLLKKKHPVVIQSAMESFKNQYLLILITWVDLKMNDTSTIYATFIGQNDDKRIHFGMEWRSKILDNPTSTKCPNAVCASWRWWSFPWAG